MDIVWISISSIISVFFCFIDSKQKKKKSKKKIKIKIKLLFISNRSIIILYLKSHQSHQSNQSKKKKTERYCLKS